MSACSQGPAPITSGADVLQVQADRFQAIVDADIKALDSVLADDLVYTHSTGSVESKADFLQSLATGTVDYKALSPSNQRVRIYDDVAVVNGDVDLHVAASGREHHVSMRFTEVYVHIGERWQLISWQSTGIP